jgi:hypothetical protein
MEYSLTRGDGSPSGCGGTAHLVFNVVGFGGEGAAVGD